MDRRVRVLFVEGDEDPTAVSPHRLESGARGFEVDGVASASASDPDPAAYDCVVCNYALADGDGVGVVSALREAHPSLPVVVYTAVGDETVARDALRAGASDYVVGGTTGEEAGTEATTPSATEEVATLERRVAATANADDTGRPDERPRADDSTVAQLETLTRVLTHDIRNDLSVVVGWADVLRDAVDEDDEEVLDRILDNGRQTLELTDVARDAVEIIVGDGTEKVEPTRLEPVLRRAVQTRRETFGDAVVEVDEVPTCRVAANSLLGSVFRNLLNDAVANHAGTDPAVRVAGERDGDTVRVRVEGGAADPDGRRRRALGESDLDSPATGISLFLVKTLVDAYGGDVRVEDDDATVVVELRAVD
jgi:signal transduction histidine kinase